MSQFTQDFRTQRRNYDDGNTRIGERDRLWYNSSDRTIRISDGVTPGGIIVAGGGSGGGGSIGPGDDITLLNNNAGYIALTDLSATGDLTYNNTTGEFSVTTYKSANFDADFATKTTDDLTQGVTNLYFTAGAFDTAFAGKSTDDLTEGVLNQYYTDAKVTAVINSTVDKTFVDALNVDADTLDGLDSTAFLQPGDLSATGDLTYNPTTGVFDVTTYKTADFLTDFATRTTDNLAEGTVNLYFTDGRVAAVVNNTSIAALLDVDSDLVINLQEDSILIYNATSNEFVAESFIQVLDRLKAEIEVQYDRLVDEEGTFTYIGEAEPGTDRATALWRIRRIAEQPDGDLDILWANGSAAFDKVWDLRATYTY